MQTRPWIIDVSSWGGRWLDFSDWHWPGQAERAPSPSLADSDGPGGRRLAVAAAVEAQASLPRGPRVVCIASVIVPGLGPAGDQQRPAQRGAKSRISHDKL